MRLITTNDKRRTCLRAIADTSWHARAQCRALGPAVADRLFFADARDYQSIAQAKALCGRCPVARDCFNHALENGIKDGIWGGLTEAERRPWHTGLDERLDYRRVLAAFQGRDVHLTQREREVITDHAYVRNWSAARLAYVLQIGPQHARDLLRAAANTLHDRDRHHGMYDDVVLAQAEPGTQPGPPPPAGQGPTTSATAPFGKAA